MTGAKAIPLLRLLEGKISQWELGRRIGRSQDWISRVETGRRRLLPEEWEEIVAALNAKREKKCHRNEMQTSSTSA